MGNWGERTPIYNWWDLLTPNKLGNQEFKRSRIEVPGVYNSFMPWFSQICDCLRCLENPSRYSYQMVMKNGDLPLVESAKKSPTKQRESSNSRSLKASDQYLAFPLAQKYSWIWYTSVQSVYVFDIAVAELQKKMEIAPSKTNERLLKRGHFKKKGSSSRNNFSCAVLVFGENRLLSNGVLFRWVGASEQRKTKSLAYMNHLDWLRFRNPSMAYEKNPKYNWLVFHPLIYSK